MLSQKTKYALRALVYLASLEPGGSASIGAVAVGAKAPRKFLEAILLELKLAGFVASKRGRFGGYVLAAPAERVTFAAVIRAVEGPLALAPCASVTAYRQCPDCFDVEVCPIRAALIASRDAVAAVLEHWTLATAAMEQPEIKSLLTD
ncbi:MAG TPA: Rrf2 family transcriptional regulator [Caulobacteraceae bacterium]|nr:Rrf2 family transcriptional regulator [Caulobacteraceae bacterium]